MKEVLELRLQVKSWRLEKSSTVEWRSTAGGLLRRLATTRERRLRREDPLETPLATQEQQDPKSAGPESGSRRSARNFWTGVRNFLPREVVSHYNNQPFVITGGEQQAVHLGPCTGPIDTRHPQVSPNSDKPIKSYGVASFGPERHCGNFSLEFE